MVDKFSLDLSVGLVFGWTQNQGMLRRKEGRKRYLEFAMSTDILLITAADSAFFSVKCCFLLGIGVKAKLYFCEAAHGSSLPVELKGQSTVLPSQA